jgi:hypothetical protein
VMVKRRTPAMTLDNALKAKTPDSKLQSD